jgi:type III pantothenate kinase
LILLIDIGNTRTKWGLLDDKNQLSSQGVCLNADIAHVNLATINAKKNVQKVFISNVAGLEMVQQVTQLLTPLEIQVLKVTPAAYGLKNNYAPTLGTDRWAALVAAWHHHQQACVVVNAGTAVTVDAISQAGEFLGGAIMPGLSLMQQSLSDNAALLKVDEGTWQVFPTNTSDAIKTGAVNAIVGAINLTLKRLEKQCGRAPLLLLSGGDANAIADAMRAHGLSLENLNLDTKQVIITENLVLQGLALLAKA